MFDSRASGLSHYVNKHMPQNELKPAEELSFEEALEELEELTARMAQGDVTLDESVRSYERGSALLKRCRSELERARGAIERLRESSSADAVEFPGEIE